MVTVAVAAELLGVSRTYVVRLLMEYRLAATRTRVQRRIKSYCRWEVDEHDLHDFKAARNDADKLSMRRAHRLRALELFDERVTCQVCGIKTALTPNGTFQIHKASETRRVRFKMSRCSGSYKLPAAAARRRSSHGKKATV